MEYYHMTKDKYIRAISKNGLQPQNGAQSKSIGDEKKVVFYSQGKEGAIVMYLSFEKMYEDLKGKRGNNAISKYEQYLAGEITLSESDLQNLENQLKEIQNIRATQEFSEYYDDGPYFSIQNLKVEDIKDKNFNFANSWVTKAISPQQLQVMALRSKENGQLITSKFDIAKYMMHQVTPEAIEAFGINDELAEYIKKYYEEHSAEIANLGNNYELETMSIEEYAHNLEERHSEQGFEELSGQSIGKSVLEQIKNTQKIEATAHQLSQKSNLKSIERGG